MTISIMNALAILPAIPFNKGRVAASLVAGLMLVAAQAAPAAAVSTRVVATVNDTAISAYQISQRVKLLKVLRPNRMRGSAKQQQKIALEDLIDEKLKTEEAKKLKVLLPVDRVEALVAGDPGLKGLAERLQKQGLSKRLVHTYIATRMSWNRIISQKFPNRTVSDAQINAQTAKFRKEIQQQAAERAVSVYELLPITLPVDRQATPELTNEVARSRLIEADGVTRRFKSCRSPRKATSGVFNVKIGKRLAADPRKMTPKMRKTLDRAGPGSAFVMGVSPDRSAVEIIAFCGRKRIAPPAPKITDDMVKQRLKDELLENLGKSYLRDLHKNAFIEYKDASLRK